MNVKTTTTQQRIMLYNRSVSTERLTEYYCTDGLGGKGISCVLVSLTLCPLQIIPCITTGS